MFLQEYVKSHNIIDSLNRRNGSRFPISLHITRVTPSYASWGGERFANKRLRKKRVDAFFKALGCCDDDRRCRNKDDLIRLFDRAHASGESFDALLFEELFRCFKSSADWGAVKEGNMIVLTPKHPHQPFVVELGGGPFEFAMGLARKSPLTPARSPSIIDGQPEPDHMWAIFRRAHQRRKSRPAAAAFGEAAAAAANRQASRWEVFQVLAVVELKMTSAVRAPFERKGEGTPVDEAGQPAALGGVLEKSIDTEGRHGNVAQELLYVVALVLWGRAALGLELPPSLPLAVVAVGKETKGKTKTKDATRWLHGNLLVPYECGGRFFYNVDSFGTFRSSSGAAALAVYLDVMTEGLEAAEIWLKRLAESRSLPPPRAMTGRVLCFGRDVAIPELTLLSHPVTPCPITHFTISQGELFHAKVNLNELFLSTTKADPGSRLHWCRETFRNRAKTVLVKVTSLCCYGILTDGRGYLYKLSEYKKLAPARVQQCLNIVSGSFYAVYIPEEGAGVVQIMPDMHTKGYRQLKPAEQLQSSLGECRMAWNAFKRLVTKVLNPLAEEDVVHVDLRPGWDYTANILYRKNKPKMRLIDLDSLIRFDEWRDVSSRVKSGKVITAELQISSYRPRTALEFVLWQAICIVHTWIKSIAHDHVIVDSIIEYHKASVFARLAESSSDSCDREFIYSELERVGSEFLEKRGHALERGVESPPAPSRKRKRQLSSVPWDEQA